MIKWKVLLNYSSLWRMKIRQVKGHSRRWKSNLYARGKSPIPHQFNFSSSLSGWALQEMEGLRSKGGCFFLHLRFSTSWLGDWAGSSMCKLPCCCCFGVKGICLAWPFAAPLLTWERWKFPFATAGSGRLPLQGEASLGQMLDSQPLGPCCFPSGGILCPAGNGRLKAVVRGRFGFFSHLRRLEVRQQQEVTSPMCHRYCWWEALIS